MKKRVLFLISLYLDGGIDSVLTEYIRNIDPSRYDVTLAIGLKTDELEVYLPRLPKSVKVRYLIDEPVLARVRKEKVTRKVSGGRKLLDETLFNPVRAFLSRKRLKELADKSDMVIDFDTTFYTQLGKLYWGKPRGTRPELVGVYHFSIAENLRQSERHTRRQMAGLAGYDRVVTVCKAMMEEGRELFPSLSPKLEMIYNGYDLEAFRNRGAQVPEGYVEGERYFLSVARLEQSQKDIVTLLKGYARFVGRCREEGIADIPRLRLIGKGKSREMLEKLAVELGVSEEVLFMGFIADPAPWIARSLALVLSSTYEGLGMVLIESLILGRATIATDCPVGPREILEDGEVGILTRPGDAEGIADAFYRVCRDGEERQRLERAGAASATRFDIRRSVRMLLKNY